MKKNIIYITNANNQVEFVEDSMMVIDASGEFVYVLGEFEKSLLNYFDGKKTLDQISQVLNEKYNGSYIEEDFMEFVEQLINKRILIEK